MAIARVNSSQVFGAGGSATVASPATSLTAGNRIVIGVRWTTGGFSISGVADTAGNTYTLIKTFAGALTTTLAMYECNNCLGHASNVVTVTFSGSATNRSLLTAQYSGSANYARQATAWMDLTASAADVTVNSTLTLTDALVVVAWQVNATGTTLTAGTNLTKVVEDSSAVQMLQEAIVTSSTTITPSGTSTDSAADKLIISTVFIDPQDAVAAVTHAHASFG